MADTKTTALDAATALTGTESFPGVQGAANAEITADQIKAFCRARADVEAVAIIQSNTRTTGQNNHPVRTAAGIIYQFYIDGNNSDLYYKKSTNYGVTWGEAVLMKTGTVTGLGTYFDKWVPSDTGTLIHIAYIDGNNVFYRSLDTATDTLGSEITVLTGTSAAAGANTCIAVSKSRGVGARVFVAHDIDDGVEAGFAKSDDYPVTAFTAKATFDEDDSDYFALHPGNYADANDMDLVFWDRSASEITLKTYDDSGDSWSESAAVATGMTSIASTTVAPQMASALRNSDGHIILVAWTNADSANADLRCFDINGAASITEKTNVVLNSGDDQAACALSIGAANVLDVFYLGKSDGSETAYTSLNVYRKRSTDGGDTWGAETLVSHHLRILSYLMACPETSDEYVVMFAGATTNSFSIFHSALAIGH